MTEQLSLLPRARKTDPDSSHAAARRVKPGKYDEAIFNLLHQYRTLTKNQICEHLYLDGPREWGTVSSRLSHLHKAGKLEWAGEIKGDGNLYRIATEVVDTQGRT